MVFKLRQINLKLAFAGLRTGAEDFKDKPGTVDNLGFPFFLELLLLTRGKVVIDDHDIRLEGGNHFTNLICYARSDQEGRVWFINLRHADIKHFEEDGVRKACGFFDLFIDCGNISAVFPRPGQDRMNDQGRLAALMWFITVRLITQRRLLLFHLHTATAGRRA